MQDGNTRGNGAAKRPFWIVFGLIAVAVVTLVVCIVIVIVQKNTEEDVVPEMTKAEKMILEIEEKTANMNDRNAIGEVYQEYADATSGDERATILKAKIERIIAMGVKMSECGDDGKEVIETAIEVDNIEQTLESASLVINMAASFNDEDTVERYVEIYNQRAKEAGLGDEETLG